MISKSKHIIFLLLMLPLLLAAQDERMVNNAGEDSLLQMASRMQQAGIRQEMTPYSEDETDSTFEEDSVEETAAPHYLLDRVTPLSADSLFDYENYPIVIREVPAAVMKKLKANKALQYDKKQKAPRNTGFMDSILLGFIKLVQVFYPVIIIVVLGGLAFLIGLFLKQNGYLQFKKKGGKDVSVELSEENMELSAYEQQIQAAVAAGKLRVAVRLLYLQTLRLLADKEIITFSKDKTNAAYLRLMSQTPWYKAFANLTLDYEYIWYGEVPVNNEQFSVIHRHFNQFMNDLGYNR